MRHRQNRDLRVQSDHGLKLKFLGSKVTTDAGPLAYRGLDEVLSFTEMREEVLADSRLGSNKQRKLLDLSGEWIDKVHQRTPLRQLILDMDSPGQRNVMVSRKVPKSLRQWTLTTLREKLIKIGAKVTRHSKYVTFQSAEVAVPRRIFAAILEGIKRLAIPPPSVPGAYA